MIRFLEIGIACEHILECTSGNSGQVLGWQKTYSPYFFMEAHNSLQKSVENLALESETLSGMR